MITFLLFLSTINAHADESKFHFKDCVTVNQGFYKDCRGEVRDILPSGTKGDETSYEVDVNCKGDRLYQDFKESYLDKCTKPKPRKGGTKHLFKGE